MKERGTGPRVVVGNFSPIAYYPIFAQRLGSVKAALMLSQLLYWTPRAVGRRNLTNGWVWKSVKEWYAETGLRRREVETGRLILESRGLVHCIVKKAGNTPICHYWVDLETVSAYMGIKIDFQ